MTFIKIQDRRPNKAPPSACDRCPNQSQTVLNRPQLLNSLLSTPTIVSQSFGWMASEHDRLHLITPGYCCLIPFPGIWFYGDGWVGFKTSRMDARVRQES
jgi:hypothetical protein